MLRWEKNLRKTQKYAKASRSQSCPVSIEQKNSGSNFFHNSAVTREILWRPRRSLISCHWSFYIPPVNISKPKVFLFSGGIELEQWQWVKRIGNKNLAQLSLPQKEETVGWRCSVKVSLKNSPNLLENDCVESHFKKVVDLQSAILLKRDSDTGVHL